MKKDSIMPVRPVSSNALEEAERALAPPDPEVRQIAERRRFSAEYKLRILRLADACTEPGSLGALLRREGLYASNLRTWRSQRDAGTLEALEPKKQGRKPHESNPFTGTVERLRKKNDRLARKLSQAELIIEVQKKSLKGDSEKAAIAVYEQARQNSHTESHTAKGCRTALKTG